jgi:hypothetical protein
MVGRECVVDRSMAKAGNLAADAKAGYVAKVMSAGGLVTASTSPKGGIFVAATKDLLKGTKVTECTAASLALDPAYRKTCCGFCARKHSNLLVGYVQVNGGTRTTGLEYSTGTSISRRGFLMW